MKTIQFDVLRRDGGMALIAVIFLLIVIGALGFAISTVMQNQGSEVGLQLTANCADYSAMAGARYRAQYVYDSGVVNVLPASQTNTMASVSGTLPSNCASFTTYGTYVTGMTWPNVIIHSQVQ